MAGLEEARCYDMNCLWRGPHGRKLQAASGSRGLQSYNRKELNPANNHGSLEEDPKFQKGMQPSQHFDCSFVTLTRGPSQAILGLLTYKNCEIINVCCFKLLQLW